MAPGRCSHTRRPRALRLQAAALVVVLAGTGSVRAAEPSHDNKQEAKARFIAGQSHYNLNEYAEALVEFKEAYRLLPDPVFLYNSGQCERQLGHLEEAIRFYRSFLREQPKAPNRQDVARKIDEMEATLKARAAETEKASSPPNGPAVAAMPAPSPTEIPQAQAVAPQPQAPPAPTGNAALAEKIAHPAPTRLPAEPQVKPEAPAPTLPGLDVSSSPPPQPSEEAFYSRWWFWTAVAVVAAGAGVGIYAATAKKAASPPDSPLGARGVF